MLNRIDLIGRLCAEPELKRTPSGVAVTSVRVACTRDFKSADGTYESDFLDIVAWRQTAEFVCRNFGKGQLIAVSGRLQTRSWTDRDGIRRTVVEIVADNCYLCGGDRKTGAPRPAGAPVNVSAEDFDDGAPPDFVPIDDDGELPF